MLNITPQEKEQVAEKKWKLTHGQAQAISNTGGTGKKDDTKKRKRALSDAKKPEEKEETADKKPKGWEQEILNPQERLELTKVPHMVCEPRSAVLRRGGPEIGGD